MVSYLPQLSDLRKTEPNCCVFAKTVKIDRMNGKRNHKRRAQQPRIRGLTVAEYHRLRRRIKDGELTWESAVVMGLVLPRFNNRKLLGRPRETGRVASAPEETT